MGSFVDVHVDVGYGVAEQGNIATIVVGVSGRGWERDHVPYKLAAVDWKATEGVDQIAQGSIAVLVVAHLPDHGTVAILDIPCLDVCRGEPFPLSDLLAVGWNLPGSEGSTGACGYFEVVDETLLEVVKIWLQRRLGQLLGGG